MLTHLSDHRYRRFVNAALAALGLLLLLAIGGAAVRVVESMDSEREEIRQNAVLLAEALDHELDIHVYNLMAMRNMADRFLSGRTLGVENPVTRLTPLPDRSGYISVLPESFGSPDQLGLITGFGPLPSLRDPVAEEMTMAIGLTPIMRAVRARSPYVPWVQYASARGFMFLFPRQGGEQFRFRPELMQREYLAGATPQANPQRKLFWTQPYEDAAGQGSIVTVTQPIYQGEQFRGSLSIDVRLTSLQRLLDSRPIRNTSTILRLQNGQPLARTQAQGDPDAAHEHDVISLPLRSAPWVLDLQINRQQLFYTALRGRAAHIGTVAVLGVSLFFLVLLVRSARRVHDLAIRDGLTGLYNRRHFDTTARLQFELARRGSCRLGLALIDIDFFKKYNDHYGHQQGDTALRSVAQALHRGLRRGADQLFRVGGEEFAVLVVLQPGEQLAPLMDKLNQTVRDLRLAHAGNPPGHMTISVGYTLIGQERWTTVDAAYRIADEALYEAKQGGRDRAAFKAAGGPPVAPPPALT